MKKSIVWILLCVCLVTAGLATGVFNSYETPEKCIKATGLLLHPLAAPGVGSIKHKLAGVEVDDTLLYLYQSKNHDVVIAELRLVHVSKKHVRYAYQDLTVYREGEYDEPGFTTIENTTRGGDYTYGLYPEDSAELLSRADPAKVWQAPVTIERKAYVFQVERVL